MGFDSDFAKGWARYLGTNVAGLVYSETTPYAATDIGITLSVLPQDPNTAVAVATYPVSDSPTLSDSVIGLQILSRAPGPDSTAVSDLRSLIFDALHGLAGVALPTGVHVVQCLHQSGAPLGRDELQRWEWTDNYYVTVWRPSANRT
jgi:hypothetical protein